MCLSTYKLTVGYEISGVAMYSYCVTNMWFVDDINQVITLFSISTFCHRHSRLQLLRFGYSEFSLKYQKPHPSRIEQCCWQVLQAIALLSATHGLLLLILPPTQSYCQFSISYQTMLPLIKQCWCSVSKMYTLFSFFSRFCNILLRVLVFISG